MKIAPDLIDDVVQKHENVVEAAAFGAIGPSGIEEIYLAVKVRAVVPEQDIVHWCATRKIEIARVFFVEDLPKTPLGKIRRDELRRRLLPRFAS